MMEESRRLKRGKKENGFILILSGNAMTRSRQTYVATLKQQQINYCNYVLYRNLFIFPLSCRLDELFESVKIHIKWSKLDQNGIECQDKCSKINHWKFSGNGKPNYIFHLRPKMEKYQEMNMEMLNCLNLGCFRKELFICLYKVLMYELSRKSL